MAVHGVMVPIVLFISSGLTAVCYPIAKAYARRLERDNSPRVPSDVIARLERMENAIESIAIEVERISEGQRFTTKLLAERPAAQLPVSPVETAARPQS